MAVVKELMRTEQDGSLSFGDYTLDQKAKLSDYEYQGDTMKVKTYQQITKLEKNGLFVYESVPGTAVEHLQITPDGMSFIVSGMKDTLIILCLEENAEYRITVDGADIGTMETNMGGKLTMSIELEADQPVSVRVAK